MTNGTKRHREPEASSLAVADFLHGLCGFWGFCHCNWQQRQLPRRGGARDVPLGSLKSQSGSTGQRQPRLQVPGLLSDLDQRRAGVRGKDAMDLCFAGDDRELPGGRIDLGTRAAVARAWLLVKTF